MVYIKKIKTFERYVYVIYDSNHKYHDEIETNQFEKDMLKRSAWQSIYLYTENDELAIKHFKWALNEKIKAANNQIDKYRCILENLSSED